MDSGRFLYRPCEYPSGLRWHMARRRGETALIWQNALWGKIRLYLIVLIRRTRKLLRLFSAVAVARRGFARAPFVTLRATSLPEGGKKNSADKDEMPMRKPIGTAGGGIYLYIFVLTDFAIKIFAICGFNFKNDSA